MNNELLTGLAAFAFVSSITPGPNNLMLMSSGANFGFKQTIPHFFGVGIGFTLMIVLVGLGLTQLFDRFPVSYEVLKVASIIYMLYLAFKIACSHNATEQSKAKVQPLTFTQAAIFQWVNPKAWTMALTAISIYAPSNSFIAVLLVALMFGLINLPCIGLWVFLGQRMQLLLAEKQHLKIFNITMASLLIVSLYPAL